MKKRLTFSVRLAIFLIVLDQILKIWIKTHMYLGEEHAIFGQWFLLHFIENEGMAFGMSFGGINGKIFLTLFRLIAAVFIGYAIFKMTKNEVPKRLLVFTVFVFAGAIGNVIDCFCYGQIFSKSEYFGAVAQLFPESGGYAPILQGKVVDMIQFDLFTINFPDFLPLIGGSAFNFFPAVFNLADTWITIGLFAIILFCYKPLSQFIVSWEHKKANNTQPKS